MSGIEDLCYNQNSHRNKDVSGLRQDSWFRLLGHTAPSLTMFSHCMIFWSMVEPAHCSHPQRLAFSHCGFGIGEDLWSPSHSTDSSCSGTTQARGGELFLYSQIPRAWGMTLHWLPLFNRKMAWPGWRYNRKKQSLMPPSLFEQGAVLGIIKHDYSRTTSFSRTILITKLIWFLAQVSWKVWATTRLKWSIFLQQPCGPCFSRPPSPHYL